MQITADLELLNFFWTFTNVIYQNLDPLFFVGLKMQVSFAVFPGGVSGALYNNQTHYSLLESVLLQDTFFPCFTILCSFFG